MKKSITVFILIILSSGCKKENTTKKTLEIETKDNAEKVQFKIDKTFLNGVWAESEDENALFEINNNTLRYVEYYDTSYLCLIEDGCLIITDREGVQLPKSKIMKLSKDSLVIKPLDGNLIRLYNRKF
ncbi:hypothetical protein [uncultured Flavobacterium sp.]|uniref:hypothetical protein n=1 Tax=uncultured Flavobacterium sp. TaxID=165435 RepID=UPI0025EDB252|nr:hypothetical protein [uncultured Flavobacterium sp.]